jgi:hypothetical protein
MAVAHCRRSAGRSDDANQHDRHGQNDFSTLHPHPLFRFAESVFGDATFHVIAAEPDGAPASERRVARRENDLFVGPHPQYLMRLNQWPCRELL